MALNSATLKCRRCTWMFDVTFVCLLSLKCIHVALVGGWWVLDPV